MASAECKKSLEAFVKASGGKAGLVAGKDNKKILTDCGLTPKYVDSASMDIGFSKIMAKCGGKAKGGLTFDQYCNEYAVEVAVSIAKKDKSNPEEAKNKFLEMLANGAPKQTGTTKAQKGGATGRLTDTSKYTGSHKERFDESGKGKGKEGREEVVDNTGYVGNYKGDKTYDKTH